MRKYNPQLQPLFSCVKDCGADSKPKIQSIKLSYIQKLSRLKRFLALLGIIIISLALYVFPAGSVVIAYAEESQSDAARDLSESIFEQLESLNLGELESIIRGLDSDESGIFSSGSFREKLESILSGDFSLGYDSFFAAICGFIFSDILSFLPIMAAIIAVCILCSMMTAARPKTSQKSIADVMYLACYGVVVILVFAVLIGIVLSAKDTIFSIQQQINVVFPVLLTLMTALGASASAGVYQPAVALLSSGIIQLMTYVIFPLFMFGIVLNFVGNISANTKLSKLSDFFFGTAKWIIGIVFAVFAAFLSVQGITASVYDGVSIRTAKYAISHYIPIIGGYLSEGFNLIMAGSMLIKNAVGLSAVLLLAATILSPVLKIIVFSLCLRLTAAIVEPICDNRITSFLHTTGKSMAMLLAIILGIAFMYFIIIMLVISTGNHALSGA